jgi:cytochrome c biogenesis protein ResB
MTESNNFPSAEKGGLPAAPGNRLLMILRTIYGFLTSAGLALTLLIVILSFCIAGVTIFRGQRAWEVIFSTLWFNGLLVLLVANVGFCFFGRIWGRKLTLISFGMILFHLSFVAMFGGIIYNSLFYFRGDIRLTEGEILPSGDPQSYDSFQRGRFFEFSKLKGETTLIRMHTGYKVDGSDKRAAYEIEVGEGEKKRGIIYITNNLVYKGFTYLPDREGYSVLTMLYDQQGRELYGGHIPLQSLKQKDDSYLYATGTKEGPGSLHFPQDPLTPLFELQIAYRPTPIKERAGEAFFQALPLGRGRTVKGEAAALEGRARIGEKVRMGNYYLSPVEIRYWVGMKVRYEPGKPVVLTSLWVGLGGLAITFIGRLRRKKKG